MQENEDEKLSKEEQDLAWEVYRKDFEWQEEVKQVSRNEYSFEQHQIPNDKSANERRHIVAEPECERKAKLPKTEPAAPRSNTHPAYLARYRYQMPVRKCTKLSHLLTLRSQGTKMGCTTVCGECAQEISWEELKQAR